MVRSIGWLTGLTVVTTRLGVGAGASGAPPHPAKRPASSSASGEREDGMGRLIQFILIDKQLFSVT
jgi:hypothetical protein